MQIARIVKKVLADKGIEIEVKPTKDKRSYHISSEKIRKELGFVPKFSVEDAIIEIKNAYLAGKIPDPVNMRYYNIEMMKREIKNLL